LTPGPSVYHPKKYGINQYSRGGKIGSGARSCFVDDAAKSKDYLPGPGNYKIPT
jgi:hypothetical protein